MGNLRFLGNYKMTDKDKTEIYALKVMLLLNEVIPEMVESILVRYKNFCETDEATSVLNMYCQPETAEMRLRILYECLCFASFSCCVISTGFFTKREWLKKRPDPQLVEAFQISLANHLIENCQALDATELQEIELINVDEDLKPVFELGDNLNPVVRMDEYLSAIKNRPGDEAELFGENIGKSLDPAYYPLLANVGSDYAGLLLMLARKVMKEVVK